MTIENTRKRARSSDDESQQSKKQQITSNSYRTTRSKARQQEAASPNAAVPEEKPKSNNVINVKQNTGNIKGLNESLLLSSDDELPSEELALSKIIKSVPSGGRKKGKKSKTKKPNYLSSDDEFPSEDLNIKNRKKEITQDNNQGSSNSKLNPTLNRQDSNELDDDFNKDNSLTIPGEPILAMVKKYYYPARILDYIKYDKYKVKLCYGYTRVIPRNKFYTRYEKEFQTCELGEISMAPEDPDYHDPKLIETICKKEEILYKVLTGNEKSAWRYDRFIEGGKSRALLAKKISQGPFNLSEYNMIAKVLRGMFIPEVAKTIDRKPIVRGCKMISEASTSIFYNYSKDLQLRFLNDVMLPEVIIRLIMDDEGVDYEGADNKMLMEYGEERWVEDLLAERSSFQMGREKFS
ncbi:4886_t:CDS:2 [Diversispora eburnea]|uniref:4886_t:CDS:1 n=1 Tax=Diversispora eburnea TaxID=1213867 RepID=A0A9N9BJY8_9GLOM|nr:4886_t:CDS:2 [Diversispora eburnea]